MAHLGRIPEVGDAFELNGVRYTVELVAGRAVDSALMELPPGSADISPAVSSEDEAESTGIED
jgi:CBS domain containing-hemolysin-like protein